MKCQSDYDKEAEGLLRQADECVDQWWEGDSNLPKEAPRAPAEDMDVGSVAVKEALRRGLVKVDEEGGICMSCPEKHSGETDSK